MVYHTYNYSIHGVYKPTYNWGVGYAPSSGILWPRFRQRNGCRPDPGARLYVYTRPDLYFGCIQAGPESSKSSKSKLEVQPWFRIHIPNIKELLKPMAIGFLHFGPRWGDGKIRVDSPKLCGRLASNGKRQNILPLLQIKRVVSLYIPIISRINSIMVDYLPFKSIDRYDILVGGLEHVLWLSRYWEFHHPNCPTDELHDFSEG